MTRSESASVSKLPLRGSGDRRRLDSYRLHHFLTYLDLHSNRTGYRSTLSQDLTPRMSPQRIPRRSVLFIATVLLAISTNACGSEPSTNDCPSTITLSVAGGAQPTIDWEPHCLVFGLRVYDAADRPLWVLEADRIANTIAPPVHYGTVPDGARQIGSVLPLQPGFAVRITAELFESGSTTVADQTFYTP